MNTEKPQTKLYIAAILSITAIVSGGIFLSVTWFSSPPSPPTPGTGDRYEIVVHDGDTERTIAYFKSKNFWNTKDKDKVVDVPRIIMAVTSNSWQQESQKIPVQIKKKLFYHTIVPMILLANNLIMQEREELERIAKRQQKGETLRADEQARLQSIARKYGMQDLDDPKRQMASLLKRVDTVPPSLALGQTAYESGYGTSRFAIEGNALFGQWTYSGNGMMPKEHRASKGNYGVAAYDWPFDSVRSYMRNLNTHKAYQELRDKRAALREQGKAVTGLALADTLGNYSERGMEYVNILKSIITVNDLAVADKASLRDEPITLVVGVDNVKEIEATESQIAQLRASGELDRIIASMRLDGRE